MRTHVTLVNPPYPSGLYPHPPFPPLSLGYLAAVLEKNHYKVDVIDCLTLGFTYEEFRNELSKRQPDIVGITSTTERYKPSLQIARIVKEVFPKCLTVIGGHHVTAEDEKALQDCASLDVVVRREGEYTLLGLAERVDAGKDYGDVLGITFRKDGKIVRNPDRPYIENLDELPFPARHFWPIDCLKKYGTVVFNLVTSRGCSYWCNFCIEVRMHGQKYRVRSVKNVVDELEFLHKTYGADYFSFVDATFTIDQDRTAELCEEIRNRKLKIRWVAGTRVDMVTKELLLKMKEAGCVSVWYGVESGTQTVLDDMRKGITVEQTIRAFEWTKEVGLKPDPNVVLGFPGETKETAWKTIKLVERLTPDYMGIYTVATPYPGTPLYDLVKEKGWLKVTDFDKYDRETPTFETPWLSMKELKKIRDQAFQHFYLRPSYILRMYAKGSLYGLAATKTAFVYLLMAIRSKLMHDSLSVALTGPSKSHF
jgi:radical SAM superfamily enzyme YgiQ (UPF0313 family)